MNGQSPFLDVCVILPAANEAATMAACLRDVTRVLPNAEVMHILTGACIFTPTGGEPLHIGAGDTLFFPAHTTGEWHITETLRKVFFIVAQ